MQKADLVIFISSFGKSVIEDKLTTPLRSSILIKHGVDFKSKLSVPFSIAGIHEDEDYILYPSNIDIYKSHLEVVKAYFLATKKICMPKLIFAGSMQKHNRGYCQKVIALIKEYNLENEIIFSGKIPTNNHTKNIKFSNYNK